MNPNFKPPKEFFRCLKDEYSRKNYGSSGYKIEDYIQEKLLSAAYGATAWIKSKAGAHWVFKIFGVQEVDLHPGFNYLYFNPQKRERRRLDPNKIRCFRRIDREQPDVPIEAIETAKRVVFTEGWKLPDDITFTLAYTSYRYWLKSSPGTYWAKELFSPIKYLDVYDGITYRCVSATGEVYWFSDQEVVSEPRSETHCECCQELRPCTDDYTGLGNLCNRCYSDSFGDEETLAYCNRHECRAYDCPNYIYKVDKHKERAPELWKAHG